MLDTQPHPGSADPSLTDPAPDRAAGAAAAAEHAPQLDEMTAIALNLLRVLHLEVVDPWNSPTSVPGEWISATDPTLAYVRLTRAARLNLAARARIAQEDRAEAVLRRLAEVKQVAEMSAIGMDMLRMLQQEAIDPMSAATVRQGLRVGAGDPGLALFRLTRAVRLNHAIRVKIAEGTLGRRRKSRGQAPAGAAGPQDPGTGPWPQPSSDQPAATAGNAAAPAAGPAGAAAQGAIRVPLQAISAAETETDGVETESEDLAADAHERLEEEDEFGCLDDLSWDEQMALVEREFMRATGAARPARPKAGTAAEPATDQSRHPSAGAPAEDRPPPETGGPPEPSRAGRPPPSDGAPTLDPSEDAPAKGQRPWRPPGRDPP